MQGILMSRTERPDALSLLSFVILSIFCEESLFVFQVSDLFLEELSLRSG
jgi:hypothetical protein